MWKQQELDPVLLIRKRNQGFIQTPNIFLTPSKGPPSQEEGHHPLQNRGPPQRATPSRGALRPKATLKLKTIF